MFSKLFIAAAVCSTVSYQAHAADFNRASTAYPAFATSFVPDCEDLASQRGFRCAPRVYVDAEEPWLDYLTTIPGSVVPPYPTLYTRRRR